MSIIYPLSMPSKTQPISPGTAKLKIAPAFVVGMVSSPFTSQQQVQEWPGSLWSLQASLPPIVDRATAEAWICFLLALNGKSGTFLGFDPAGFVPPQTWTNLFGSDPIYGPAGSPAFWQNMILFSEEFENAAWIKQNSCTVTADAYAPPTGANNGDQLTAGNIIASGVHQQWTADGSQYTIAVRVRAGSGSNLAFGIFDSTASSWPAGTAWIASGAGAVSSAGPVQVTGLNTAWTYIVFSMSGASVAGHTLHFFIYPGGNTPANTLSVGVWGALLLKFGFAAGSSPNYTPTYDVAPAALVVDGAGQSGKVLNTRGWPPNIARILRQGEYLQIGSGATTRLYKALNDVTPDTTGRAALDIFPQLRESPADGAAIALANSAGTAFGPCRGAFRLADNNQAAWDLDAAMTYGINFSAIEAF